MLSCGARELLGMAAEKVGFSLLGTPTRGLALCVLSRLNPS